MPAKKSMSLNYKELFHFEGGAERQKRGIPENEDISLDMYENKCRKI
jgi:hypothetical protein